MKKYRQYLIVLVAVAAVAATLLIGSTVSYFTDTETRQNIITVGKVDVSIVEKGYDPQNPPVAVPGKIITKPPQLTNNGLNDEYVFIEVEVPKANITLLNADGTKTADATNAELYKMIADGETKTVDGTNIEFAYHHSDSANSKAGWVFLQKDITHTDKDVFVFGYNQKLSVNDSTVTLFDKVQLKSFIDEEISQAQQGTLTVKAYGIQADKLGIENLGEYLSDEHIQEIYNILLRKAGKSV